MDDFSLHTHAGALVNPLRRRLMVGGMTAGALAFIGQGRPLHAQTVAPTGNTDDWNAGQLAHLVPTASHDRFLIKVSFKAPLREAPRLRVDRSVTVGVRTDVAGRFWQFDVQGLQPSTGHTLQIVDAGGEALCGTWPLATFPAPDARPKQLRIVAYTCAGGSDGPRFRGKTGFLDMAARRRLLARALSLAPDALIANGDHIYWDQVTALNKPFAEFARNDVWPRFGGALDLTVPMLDPRNASIFLAVCDQQIAGLYGAALRSTPSFFLTDDHDYFENDEFDDKVATLPPDSYGLAGAEQTQRLYYPEFLPDANRPAWLPGGDRTQLPIGANTVFGTLRYGRLCEAVLYDCRRFVDYKGRHARVLPQWAENWLVARTRAEDTDYFFHVPSLPFGYSSGKLGDWYPDRLDEKSGRLVLDGNKPGWQSGWYDQHQRLLAALASQQRRQAMVVAGDFHAAAAEKLARSGDLRLDRPVHVVLTGPLGTGDLGFPSAYRGVESRPSLLLESEQALAPTEKNGFTVIDVTADDITYSIYTWRPPQPLEEIDSMAPTLVYRVSRQA